MATTAEPTQAQRMAWAKSGVAMPDGSYYILNAEDLENAIRTVGLGNASNPAIRKHIITRANALNLSSKLPATWNSDGTTKPAAHSAITDFLEHFGVLGMKWGVTKGDSKSDSDSKSGSGDDKDEDEKKSSSGLKPEHVSAGKKFAQDLIKQEAKRQIKMAVSKGTDAAVKAAIAKATGR